MEHCKAMEGGESGSENRKTSFGFSLGDDRIKLIDILSEDGNDDFLVASPFCDSLQDCFSDNFAGQGGFRVSGFGNYKESEIILQTEHNLFPSDNLQRGRPSFLRRSLAWDNAFYNSAGVLDPDELSFINKGFGTNEVHQLPSTRGAHKRRSKVESIENGDGFPDWFEIDPFASRRKSTYISKSTPKKVGSVRSGKGAISSPRPPKATARTGNSSTRSNKRDVPRKFNVKMENSSAKTGPVTPTAAMVSTGPVPLSVTSIGTSSPQSSPRAYKRKIEPRSCNLSATLSTTKVWRDSERSKGMVITTPSSPTSCASNSSSQSHSYSSSTKQRSNVSGTGFDMKCKIRGRSLHSNVKEESDMHCKLSSPLIFPRENHRNTSPKQYNSRAAADTNSDDSLKNFRPSELRPPSPTIGFFDEKIPLISPEALGRKMPQKKILEETLFGAKAQFRNLDIGISSDSSFSSRNISSCKKLQSGISDIGRKIKRSKTPHTHPSHLTEREKCLTNDGKRPRNKLCLNSSLEEEKRRGLLKNKRCKGSQGPANGTRICDAVMNPIKNVKEENGKQSLYHSGDQIGNLSKCLQAISLDQHKKMPLKHKYKDSVSPLSKQERHMINSPINRAKPCPLSPLIPVASVSNMRTPLADKSSISNTSS